MSNTIISTQITTTFTRNSYRWFKWLTLSVCTCRMLIFCKQTTQTNCAWKNTFCIQRNKLTWDICLQLWSQCFSTLWDSSTSCLRREASENMVPVESRAGGVPGEQPRGKCSQILLLIPFRPTQFPEKSQDTRFICKHAHQQPNVHKLVWNVHK